MSVWHTLTGLLERLRTGGLAALLEMIRTVFSGDPAHRRRVAFSIAMIALSAKMAKSDGVVTPAEVVAFRQIFQIPGEEARNVDRLFDLARQDVAGFEAYAGQIAELCTEDDPNCRLLEDVVDGLFHIAKADGVLHDAELLFIQRVATIFDFEDAHYDTILARHVDRGDADPFAILGVSRDDDLPTIRRQWKQLLRENHPDVLMSRDVPEEFVVIATERTAAFNDAFNRIARIYRDEETRMRASADA